MHIVRGRRLVRTGALAALLICCAGLWGCASAAGGEGSPAAESSGPPVDVVLPPKAKPGVPPVALEQTEEGATQFVLWYFSALNWALANNDESILIDYTGASCGTCNSWIAGMTKRRAAGDTLIGGGTAPRSLSVGPLDQGDDVTFVADFVSNAALVRKKDGQEQVHAGLQGQGSLVITWLIDKWVMSSIDLPDPQAAGL